MKRQEKCPEIALFGAFLELLDGVRLSNSYSFRKTAHFRVPPSFVGAVTGIRTRDLVLTKTPDLLLYHEEVL